MIQRVFRATRKIAHEEKGRGTIKVLCTTGVYKALFEKCLHMFKYLNMMGESCWPLDPMGVVLMMLRLVEGLKEKAIYSKKDDSLYMTDVAFSSLLQWLAL